MPTNSESLNRELFRLLSKYKPKPLDAEGKVTPVPEEADVFKFEFTKDGEDYGTVYVTIDEERVLTLYYGDDVADSPGDKTPGLGYDDTWWGLHDQLSAWRMTKGLRGFKTQNKDRVGDDMARRNHMRNKDKIAEGYYPMGKSRSYSDAVPSVKIVIEHSRVIEEGEQRYRNINKIFLENQEGERYLLDTKKPGIARVYARHIAEGGKVNDDRWNHVHSLCEEYSKMAGFVRATRNGQFNESAQSLVNEGIAHYVSLRESLSRMTGKRGYNAYFESWTPPLMEDGTEENNLNELFVQETLDPRIESVMPILNRIHKKVSESVIDKEMNKLAEWADSLTEEESIKSNNPVGIPEEEELEEGSFDPLKHIDKKNQNPAIKQAAKDVKRGSYADRAALMKAGGVKDDRGPNGVTSMEESGLQAYLGDKKYGEKGMDALRKAGREHSGKAKMQSIRAKFSNKEKAVSEEVDTGEYDARKSTHKGETTPEQQKNFREKVQAYGKELEQRQKEKGVAEGSNDDELNARPGMWRGKADMAKRMTKKGEPTKAEKDFQDNLKNRIKASNRQGGLTGPKSVLPEEQGVAEGSHEEQVARLAAYNERMAGENPPIDLGLREVGNWAKVGHYGNPIKTAWYNIAKYGIRNNKFNDSVDKAMTAIGDFPDKYDLSIPEIDALYSAYETVYDQWEQSHGAANENFINQADQAVTSEGEHTQHAMRGRNPGANEFEHDFEPEDKIGNIHDKISRMLKRLEKPKHEPNMKDTDLGSTVLDEAAPWEDEDEEDKDKKPTDKKGSDGADHDGHSRAKHLAKQAIPKEKEEVKEGQDDLDRILTIMNHRR
jgi:hypothetical protein